MAYVYRYIDAADAEVRYIGKVKGDDFQCLVNRHKQHRREDWYQGHAQTMVFQYAEVPTAADADILETLAIAYYAETGQLVNKDKTKWGKPEMYSSAGAILDIDWRTYAANWNTSTTEVKDAVARIVSEWWVYCQNYERIEPTECGINTLMKELDDRVRPLVLDMAKGEWYRKFGKYEDFKRTETEKGEE